MSWIRFRDWLHEYFMCQSHIYVAPAFLSSLCLQMSVIFNTFLLIGRYYWIWPKTTCDISGWNRPPSMARINVLFGCTTNFVNFVCYMPQIDGMLSLILALIVSLKSRNWGVKLFCVNMKLLNQSKPSFCGIARWFTVTKFTALISIICNGLCTLAPSDNDTFSLCGVWYCKDHCSCTYCCVIRVSFDTRNGTSEIFQHADLDTGILWLCGRMGCFS